MCTVTLTALAGRKSFVLTSNRDEAAGRETLPPKVYLEGGVKMLFPKDVEAGGTWLGVSGKKRLLCLLNGGFENHLRKPPYRMSRGIVVLELLAAEDFSEAIENFNFLRIEPFTLIVVEWQFDLQFSEVVWDGQNLHVKQLDSGPHIWSSSPLYSEEMKREREEWFKTFKGEKELLPEHLWDFHNSAGVGDKNRDVIMDRGFVKTKSISQVILSEEKISFSYKDLSSEEVSKMTF